MRKLIAAVSSSYGLIVVLIAAVLAWAIAKVIAGLIVVCLVALALLAWMKPDRDMPMGGDDYPTEFSTFWDPNVEYRRAQRAAAEFLRQRNNVLGMHDGIDL